MWKAILAMVCLWPCLGHAELIPDPAFGNGGQVTYAAPGKTHLDRPRIALVADRRIAVTSVMLPDGGGVPELVLLRLLPDGQPDPAFNGGAASIVPLSSEAANFASILDLQIQPDGSRTVVAAPSTFDVDSARTMLLHATADGRADPAFNGGQPLQLADGLYFDRLRVFVSDDAFLVVGTDYPPCCANIQSGFRAWRVRRDGTPDPAFGSGGSLVVAASGWVTQDAMPVPGGGFQVLQRRPVDGALNLSWRRYRADGSVDTTFGNGGEAAIPLAGNESFFDVEPLGDGTFAGMAATCLQRTLDAQGNAVRRYGGTCAPISTNPRIQRYGGGYLVSGEQRFGGTPPPTDGTYLWVLGADGDIDAPFAEPQIDRWRKPAPGSTGSFNVAGDGGRSVLLAGRSGNGVTVFRYLDVRRGSVTVSVPALGLPALLLLLAGAAMVATRRLRYTGR